MSVVGISERGIESPLRRTPSGGGQVDFVGDLTTERGYEFFTSRVSSSSQGAALWAVDDTGEATLRFSFEGVDASLDSATFGQFNGQPGLDILAISNVAVVQTMTLFRGP